MKHQLIIMNCYYDVFWFEQSLVVLNHQLWTSETCAVAHWFGKWTRNKPWTEKNYEHLETGHLVDVDLLSGLLFVE